MKRTAALLLLFAFARPAAAAPRGAGFYDTSEYLMGKIAVNIVFVQSDGSIAPRTEINGWTGPKKSAVINGVTNAMSWWVDRNSAANLSFVYNNTTLTTGYEPINCNVDSGSLPCINGEEDWIKQVMGKLGYTEPDYGDRVFHYNNDMRAANDTDWAFTIFMVDSELDGDGEFPDAYFAYAYIGGPFMVMTYNNDSYGIGDLAAVTAHEMGHIFYALDEYDGPCALSQRSGYLDGPNSNCENTSGVAPYSCIMRGDTPPYDSHSVCPHTARMLGWSDDSPVNGILDIIDLPPTTALKLFTPDPTSNTSPVYYGMAHSTAAYHNGNHYDYWGAPRTPNDININRIASVEYNVDSAGWTAATPLDGAFNHYVDSFTFTAASLASTAHVIQARAKDVFSAYDASPASDSLTVNTGQALDIPYVFDGTGIPDIDYTRSKTSLSANWGASSHPSGINRYEYAVGTSPGGFTTLGWTSAGTALGVTAAVPALTEGGTYYFSVKAYPNTGVVSGVTSSDGLIVDTTSPTAKVLLTSPVPVRTGAFSAKLVVNEASPVSGTPQLSFTDFNGLTVPLAMNFLVDSTWTASGYIESYYSTGTATFNFGLVDLAGNTGTSITAGGAFNLNPSLTAGSGGVVSNSDGDSVTLPAGSYAGTIFVSISTVPLSSVAAADTASADSKKIFSTDLAREFSARDGAGNPVTVFSSPVTITMSYPDADSDGRIDMDLLKESTAWLYYKDPSAGKWTPLPGVVRNTAANTLSAPVSHFSVYSVRAAGAPAADIGSLKAYPNPCDLRSVPGITIEGIPADAAGTRVFIYNEAGELVRSLAPGDGIDGLNLVSWDGRLKGGARAASGLYLYLVKTSNYGKGSGKFFIIW